ncbi:hypothetical protein BGW36DRAFT_364975 [Talaromyces proteolyticus]|uniref:Uncharacterized protein n=1 Tax=Talaromyces proteolyticus TaxID=1131652 RepID=A0AAD4PVG0_9EURO|nr:uncharacterized protein BGW36DRAFT_364975 [Talaromyces proteolyticus]KAH8690253.1 hypothetical protein BGW36DRAFT_364975 [Talaromyces proteolyticus]
MDYSDSVRLKALGDPRDLQEENDVLRYRLDAAISKIMKLQSATDQITDVDIGRRVESLQDAIQWWVNSVGKDLRKRSRDFRSIFHRALDRKDQASIIRELGLANESCHDSDVEWIMWLVNLSTCIYIVLGRHIWEYLSENIFSET